MKIIILHGLYMHGLAMLPLSRKLRSLGYRTKTISYNSLAIDEEQLFERIDSSLSANEPNVLVGHSLGGVVIKHYLHDRKPSIKSVSHAVTIGSPLRGASIVTRIQELGIGAILGNSPDFGLAQNQDRWTVEQRLGSIAGTLQLGARSILMMDNQILSDGTVTVEETNIDGMCDHIELKNSHTSLIYSSTVPNQIDHFIRHSAFRR